MVLFVFEGKKPEVQLFGVINSHFLKIGEEKIVSVFHTNIFKLYEEVRADDDVRTLDVIKGWLREHGHQEDYDILKDYRDRDFTEVYLFFDYDIHAATSYLHLDTTDANREIAEMIALFDDETVHGKLYISYPMVEAYLYTKQMPDGNFCNYTYSISTLNAFKEAANEFSDYTQNQFTASRSARSNWQEAVKQNVAKANHLCTADSAIPTDKGDIVQKKIFERQVDGYVVPRNEVSVLCGLPLFVFDYLRSEIFEERVLRP